MNKEQNAELRRAIAADLNRLNAETRKTSPDLELVQVLANGIAAAAVEIAEAAGREQRRLAELHRNFIELLPELLGEKAGN